MKNIVKVFVISAILAIGVGAYAQSVKVIPLSVADTAKVKALYDEQAKVIEEILAFEKNVRLTYLADEPTGFFEYSEDFKYLVPNDKYYSPSFKNLCTAGTAYLGISPADVIPAPKGYAQSDDNDKTR